MRPMNWRIAGQLALVHVGVSITVVPVTSTLNRILIADLGMSALLVSVLVALPYLLSPLQVILGHWADRHPLGGYHRMPWMVVGGLMASFGSYLTAHAAYWMADNMWVGLPLAVLVFVVWGVGVNVASVSYLSLVSELAHEDWRTRVVSLMWTAMILSTIVVAAGLSVMLEDDSPEALFTAFGAVWLTASVLVVLGSAGVEPHASTRPTPARHSADNPLQAYRVVTANPMARRFFVYLVLVLVSIHAQDVLLEPYGAEVLGMPVSMTTRLTSIWGVGVLVSLVGGLPLVRRWGKKRSANVGAAVAAGAFALIILAGVVGSPAGLMGAVLVLGLGGGLMTVSNLSFMLDMTVAEAAGLYIGAWGVANFAGQALGNVISGLLRDLFFAWTGNPLVGYSAVFGMEILGLLAAIALFRTISVEAFQAQAQATLADVLTLLGPDTA